MASDDNAISDSHNEQTELDNSRILYYTRGPLPHEPAKIEQVRKPVKPLTAKQRKKYKLTTANSR